MADQQANPARTVRLEADELSILCEQISLILRSGLPLHDGVEALGESYRNTRLAAPLEALLSTVLSTGSLYQGIVVAGVFPRYLTAMANIGERTGELDTVMSGLSDYYRREAKIKRAITHAIAYPLVLLAMMAALIGVLITSVLPIFQSVFRSMGVDASESPWMALGIGIGQWVLLFSGVFIVIVLVLLLAMRLDRTGRFGQWIIRHIAPLRRISDQISASRFASVMAMMLKSGFPLDESLSLISGIVSNADLSSRVESCRNAMEAGQSFPEAVDGLGFFSPLHTRMIRMGFLAGQTEIVMAKLRIIYEDEVDDAITRSVSIIEPSLVALMSVIIGAILLAVMLPLLSLMGAMV